MAWNVSPGDTKNLEPPKNLRFPPTSPEPRANDINIDCCLAECVGCPSNNQQDDVGAWSDDKFEIPNELMEALVSIMESRVDGPLPPECTELVVRVIVTWADSLEVTFQELGTVECIERAVELRSQALSLTPEGHPERAERMAKLGVSLWLRFEHFDELADVNKAIECLSQAMRLTPDSHTSTLGLLNNLAITHASRSLRLGDLSDVEKAIKYQTAALLLISDGDEDKPSCLTNLGNLYLNRFECLSELADLDKAIGCQTQAVLLTPDGHAYKPGHLSNLGTAYLCRFERLGELTDLDKAVQCQIQAVQLTPDGHADRPSWLTNLGRSYLARFERLGELSDVGKAIECLTKALLLTPGGHAGEPNCFTNLGNAYLSRFDRLGEPADAEEAMGCHTRALLLTPNDHAEKPNRLNNLGNSYFSRFQRHGELSDLDNAIEFLTQPLLLTHDNHSNRPGRLINLGNTYVCRFRCLGQLADADKAIECLTQAVALAPDGHEVKPSGLNDLGTAYMARFDRLGELADANKAIECQTQALMLTPDGHAHKAAQVNDLGTSYQHRFRSLGELADADKAVECHTRAVLLTPDGHAGKPGLLTNLGASHLSRFKCLGELTDVDKAIEYQTQAVVLTPDGHADRPGWLNNLGNSHRARFERLDELPDIDKAIECHTQAVLLTPDGHFDTPNQLNNLGDSYLTRFKVYGKSADLESARLSFQRAAQHLVTDPEIQMWCARGWAECSSSLHISPLAAYTRCMELIPHIIWIGTTIKRRYSLLTTISDLAVEAAAWAISAQSYELALEWLEQGRSVVWNQVLQLRTPFDDLSAVDSSLAKHLKSVAVQLEGAGTRSTKLGSSNGPPVDLEKEAQRHRRLAEDWEKALMEARNIPGLENFMRPHKTEELKRSATNGPVVVINMHSTRCDALVISPEYNDILHIPLNELSLKKASEFRTQLYASIGHRGGTTRWVRLLSHKPDDSFKTMLADLWSVLVGPVLNALGPLDKVSVDQLPHVTWCATGALSFLPLHAAGPYNGSSPNAFDLIISSYTPTLSALLSSSSSISEPDIRLLVVGQESTPHLPSLPFTVQELEVIKSHAEAIQYMQLDGENAKVEAVLCGMDEHSWVHLACHASQNPDNPAHSAFHLQDGNLTLETITKRQFKNKGLAFLSACQTATGDGKLPDEAVHLAAGTMMAGYPSVIATMWPICDADGPAVAGLVYKELLKDGKMDHRGAAKALHKAVAELRENLGEGSSERWRWVPFIHIGV